MSLRLNVLFTKSITTTMLHKYIYSSSLPEWRGLVEGLETGALFSPCAHSSFSLKVSSVSGPGAVRSTWRWRSSPPGCQGCVHMPSISQAQEVFNEADLDQWRSVLRLFSKIAEWLGNVPTLGKELNTSHGFIFLYSNFYFVCEYFACIYT